MTTPKTAALEQIAQLTNVGRGDIISLQDALHEIHKLATVALSNCDVHTALEAEIADLRAQLERAQSPVGWGSSSLPSAHCQTGLDWAVSEETKRHIEEIDRNIREAPQNIARAQGLIGGTNFCGHGIMAVNCPTCSIPSTHRGSE